MAWRLSFGAISLLLVVLSTSPVIAHAPIRGIGAFYNGILHPVVAPSHLLLVVGLGLLLGQHAPRQSRYGLLGFVAIFWIALVAGSMFDTAVPQPVLLALALVAGLLVALERSMGLVAILAVAAGVVIGLDSKPDGVQARELWLVLLGTAIGVVIFLSYIGGVAATFTKPWQRIGIRVAGSWTAASAGIVLAVTLIGRATAV